MTKRSISRIADALKACRPVIADYELSYKFRAAHAMWQCSVKQVADVLAGTYKSFRRSDFLAQAGYDD